MIKMQDRAFGRQIRFNTLPIYSRPPTRVAHTENGGETKQFEIIENLFALLFFVLLNEWLSDNLMAPNRWSHASVKLFPFLVDFFSSEFLCMQIPKIEPAKRQ